MKLKKIYILGIQVFITLAVFSQTPDFTGLKVMINPGHGGHDSDDRGMPNGFWESEGNLTKGLWLRDLLEARGCEVIMSRVLNRTEDDLPLSQIAQIANENEVDLFISIHSNAGNQRTNYCMTIFNGKSETPSIPEAKVWARILWEHLLTNKATYWTSVSPNYIGDLTLNPDWTYGYGVLYPLQVPGIISEGSMHDYQPEMDRLLNLDYRRQESWNILFAMEEYFQLPGSEAFGMISGIIRDSLLEKDNYNIAGSPDKYEVVNLAQVELLETGEIYEVDNLNTGYYYFDSLAPGIYHLVFSAEDYFSDTLMVSTEAHRISYHNHWLEADKTMAPKIVRISPLDGDTIACNDAVKITFNMNMDSASVADAFSIEPETQGFFTWDEDYLSLGFYPLVPYDTSTSYTIKIDTLAMHQWGVNLDSARSVSFFTGNRNRYSLDKSFPANNQTDISPYLQFRLQFDAPINNSSLINSVFIERENGGIITTKAASIYEIEGKGHYYFMPAEDLAYSSNYILKIKGTVRDENNIPLVDSLDIPFSTSEAPGVLRILDEFEDLKTWAIDFDSSPGLEGSSFLYKWSKTFRSGSASTLFRYNFTQHPAEALLVPANPLQINPEVTEAGIWIWGEMSNNEIYFLFGDEIETLITPIDFAGWKYCSIEFPANISELKGIKLKHFEGAAATGDIYFDAIGQPDNTGMASPHMLTLKVYPNPFAGNEIKIQGLPVQNCRYTLVNLNGSLITKGWVNMFNNEIFIDKKAVQGKFIILSVFSGKEKVSFLIGITD